MNKNVVIFSRINKDLIVWDVMGMWMRLQKILTVLQWRDVILPDIWLPTQSVCLREQVL